MDDKAILVKNWLIKAIHDLSRLVMASAFLKMVIS